MSDHATEPDYAAALAAIETLSGELRKMPAGGQTLYDIHARRLAMMYLDVSNVCAQRGPNWFVTVCTACWPEATIDKLVGEMPFRTLDERDEWEKAHAAGTGHNAFIEAHA